MRSPYRGGPPPKDDEPAPDFRVSAASAGEEALGWVLLSAVPASFTFVAAPLVCAASLTAGLVAGGIAYATHAKRRAAR